MSLAHIKQIDSASNMVKEEKRQQQLMELGKQKQALEAKLASVEEVKEKRKIISNIEKLNSKINKVKTGKLMSSKIGRAHV